MRNITEYRVGHYYMGFRIVFHVCVCVPIFSAFFFFCSTYCGIHLFWHLSMKKNFYFTELNSLLIQFECEHLQQWRVNCLYAHRFRFIKILLPIHTFHAFLSVTLSSITQTLMINNIYMQPK